MNSIWMEADAKNTWRKSSKVSWSSKSPSQLFVTISLRVDSDLKMECSLENLPHCNNSSIRCQHPIHAVSRHHSARDETPAPAPIACSPKIVSKTPQYNLYLSCIPLLVCDKFLQLSITKPQIGLSDKSLSVSKDTETKKEIAVPRRLLEIYLICCLHTSHSSHSSHTSHTSLVEGYAASAST